MRRAALAGLLLASGVAAGEIRIELEETLRWASLVAEARVLWVSQPGRNQRPRRGNQRLESGRVRIRVTSDPRRIFKGHTYLGQELEIEVAPERVIKTWGHLTPMVNSKAPFLVVADEARRLVLGGYVAKEGYRVKGWVDFRAVHLVCENPRLGKPLQRDKVFVFRRSLFERFREEGRTFWAQVARHIVTDLTPPERARFQEWVALLASRSPIQREYAQQALLDARDVYLLHIKSALESADDPEARRRLQAILEVIGGISRVTRTVLELDPKDQVWVVREALPKLQGRLLEDAVGWLEREDRERRKRG